MALIFVDLPDPVLRTSGGKIVVAGAGLSNRSAWVPASHPTTVGIAGDAAPVERDARRLDRLVPERVRAFAALNARYRERFAAARKVRA